MIVYLHPTFGRVFSKATRKEFLEDKVIYNEQENISAIKKKEKKQTRFQGAYGICKR
jgi:predicted transglutaminase-like protease